MSMEIGDVYLEGISDCCSAKVYVTGQCADCGEHCDVIPEE
jgi:hypothetical protein